MLHYIQTKELLFHIMKLSGKIFDVLEFVFLQNGNAVTPGMTAETLDLSPATAARILQDLTARGYLQQLSRKSGYVPGPMVVTLAARKNTFTDIAAAAKEPIRFLSEKLRRQVNISVWDGTRRIMLCFHLPQFGLSPWNHFFFTDHWQTASGRLLLASLEQKEAEQVCRSCKIPQECILELTAIRQNGFVQFKRDGLVIMGHLVQVPGYPAAAFGFGVPLEQEKEAFALSAETARVISFNLCQHNKAY